MGAPSRLCTATLALRVLMYIITSGRSISSFPIQPIAACVRGVLMVYIPFDQLRLISPVSDMTSVALSAIMDWFRFLMTFAPGGIGPFFSQGNSGITGMTTTSLPRSEAVRAAMLFFGEFD